VIERLVGMQAQWPSAPYVGIWTRTTDFRRDALERELKRRTIVKATAMRQTLHLVTRRDYGLLRAAMSETNFPSESSVAKRLEPSVRALAASGPVSSPEALAFLEREHGLTGIEARRAWQAARVRAHLLHHHETALWNGRPGGSFVALEEPEPHDPTEARAEIVRRYLAAFGPASVGDFQSWSGLAGAARAIDRRGLRVDRDAGGRELFDRTRVLPEEHRKTVIRMNGDVAQTFLVDGFVAGIWSVEKGRVVADPFAALSPSARREVKGEAERLGAFIAD
jgi:hypothetical protein